jgi:PAS domain S-box-containing protein
MTAPPDRESLYEISLAITTEETLEATAARALSAYLAELDCAAGAVMERRTAADGRHTYEPVYSTPNRPADDDALEAALGRLPDGEDGDGFPASLPVSGTAENGRYYHLMALPEFGVLALVRPGEPFDEGGLDSLAPLNERLADACREKREVARLREERSRFEAVFEAIPDPIAYVSFSEGEAAVQRVNSAFEAVFGYDEEEVLGRNPNELIVPDRESERESAQQIEAETAQGRDVKREVRRETVDGVRDFLFRTGSVDTQTDHREQFGMYIDITERKDRERKLESLYEVTHDALVEDTPENIPARAIEAADDILEFSIAGIHKHDRSREALVPVATTSKVTEVFDGSPDRYADRDTVVWEVYRTGEPVLIDDLHRFDGKIPGEDTPSRSAIVLPLEDYGIFIVSSTDPNAFDETDFYFARLLSTTVTAALDRAHREEGLEAVQQITRASLNAETQQEIADEVMANVPETLDLPISSIWKYDDAERVLRPLASTREATDQFDEIPSFTEGDSIAWQTFQRGETEVVEDVRSRPNAYNPESVLASEIVAPIGEFGVLSSGSMTPADFTSSERQLVETLTANLETAFELVSRRQDLQLLDQVLSRILRHNIRNALLVIQSRAEHIVRQGDGPIAEKSQEIVAKCSDLEATAESARSMRKIISSRDQLSSMQLRTVVEDVVAEMRSDHSNAEIETTVDAAPAVDVHPEFPTALQHLIENSIEHFEPTAWTDDVPRVAVRVVDREGGVALEVDDNGPGIPDMEVEVLEQHGETALQHGSGIGLWIVDRVVEYSNARLDFDTSSQGTTARIRFG